MYEVKSIMEDFRMQAIGGMAGAWELWEAGICASLLSNCSTWVKMSKEAFKKLNKFQNQFLRMIYACPPSTPLPALRSQAGMLGMEERIWLEKISLVAVIMHQTEPQNHSRQILEEQVLMGWEGLAKEAKELCGKLGLPDVTKRVIHREEIKSAVACYNLKTIKEEMAPYQKLDKIKNRDCRKMEPYMSEKSLEDSRLEFLWLTDMLDTRTTMPGKYKRQLFCPHCSAGRALGATETPDHFLRCDAYREFREGVDPELNQRDRARYLRNVIRKREELEKKLRQIEDSDEEDEI